MDEERVLVLGGELAAARAAEHRHVRSAPSPIAEVVYPEGSGDLWRWVERPQDAILSEFVRSYVAADEPMRAATRASLSMDDLYTLLLFTSRRCLAAIRTGDPAAAGEAFDALSAIDIDRVDWRDVSLNAMLAAYASSSAGTSPEIAAAGAIGRADRRVAEVLSDVVEEDHFDLADSCGYRVVSTPEGAVLLEDGGELYEPERDLAPLLFRLAGTIEAEGTYQIRGMGIGEDIPAIWVAAEADERVACAIDNLTGCVTIDAIPLADAGEGRVEHFLNIYLAEAASARDATAIADGASRGGRPGSVVLGVAAERLCAVIVAACVVHGHPARESTTTLARFQRLVTQAIT